MVYLLNVSNYKEVKYLYSFDGLFFKFYDNLSKIDDALLMYRNSQKQINKTKKYRCKIGFSNPSKFDVNKCKENILVVRNLSCYDGNIEEFYKVIDHCNLNDKLLIVFFNSQDSLIPNDIVNYVKDNSINYKFNYSSMDNNDLKINFKKIIRICKIRCISNNLS
mgnify:CR=1 FL=1